MDSLANFGYTFPEAHAIAESVCRDPGAVNNPEVARTTMLRIIAENPPVR